MDYVRRRKLYNKAFYCIHSFVLEHEYVQKKRIETENKRQDDRFNWKNIVLMLNVGEK